MFHKRCPNSPQTFERKHAGYQGNESENPHQRKWFWFQHRWGSLALTNPLQIIRRGRNKNYLKKDLKALGNAQKTLETLWQVSLRRCLWPGAGCSQDTSRTCSRHEHRVTGCRAACKGSWDLRREVQKRRGPQKGNPQVLHAHSAQTLNCPLPCACVGKTPKGLGEAPTGGQKNWGDLSYRQIQEWCHSRQTGANCLPTENQSLSEEEHTTHRLSYV